MNKRQKKKRILVFENPPTMKVGKLYEGLIKHISDIDDKTSHFHVLIENRDPSQAGRIHTATLSSKLFDGSQADRFLTAAGQDSGTGGKQFCLDDIVGTVVGMRFSSSDGRDQAIEFERIEPATEDKDNDSVLDDRPEALL